VHFEMPYHDKQRMSRFYESAFGWETQALGAEMGDYVLATTSPVDDKGRPAMPGAINGGFFPIKPDWPAQVPSVVIAIEDIHAAMSQIQKAGGTVLGEPIAIPGVGLYVSFTDTEGNRASLMQPQTMAP
jgi:predicted enzyme related to lactoylglutathione lyase